MAFQLNNISEKPKKEKTSFDIDSLLKKEISLFGNSFSNKKKENFYIELGILLKAGLELKDAIELIGNEQKKASDKELFNSIVDDLINGKNLSDAIKRHKSFTNYEFYSLQIGEQTGTLQKVSEELGNFYKRKNEQRRIIVSALSYPIVVLITAFLAVFFMLRMVVPMFADIFKQNKVELPWVTKKIIALADFSEENAPLFFLFILLIVGLLFVVKNKLWFRKISSAILLKTPFIGDFTRKIRIAQFTQAISLLVAAKVPLLNGLQLTQKMIRFYPLQTALQQVESDILQGISLHKSVANQPIFDKKMASLLKVAEETNQNEIIFKRLTYQYNEEIEYRSKMINATIEPILILVLGGIVAVILIAMYLPMFKLSTVIT